MSRPLRLDAGDVYFIASAALACKLKLKANESGAGDSSSYFRADK